MKSWRKQVAVLMTLILIIALMFLNWLAFTFNVQYSTMLRRENESNMTLWTNIAVQRLNAIHSNVYEILLRIHSKATTAPGSGELPVGVQVEIKDLMQNLLLVNADADCYFLIDTDTGKDLIMAPNAQKFKRTLALKEYIRALDPQDARSSSDMHWSVCGINEELYFRCYLRAGKYTAGAFCRAEIFNDIGDASVFPEDVSLSLVLTDGTVCTVQGQNGQSSTLSAEDAADLINGNDTSADFPLLGCRIVLSKEKSSLFSRRSISILLLLTFIVLFALIALVTLIILRKVADPTRILLHAQEQIAAGNLDYRITSRPGSSEFNALYNSFNDMANQIRSLRISSYDNLLKEEENKFRMVRAQIRPHFYLNSITVIHNMTYQNRLEDIRSYIQALARYIRYMLNIQSPMIAISAELTHIENYIKMQDLRFPESVKASYHCDKAISETEIPFLMLFTVVENSFKHAMNLYSTMELNIICEPYSEDGFSGIRLIVEDNGDGYSPEVLEHFSGPVPEDLPAKDHLGLSNVQYTLRYVYRRSGLLRLSNLEHGARTEILIPAEVKQIETTDMR